MTQSHKPLRPKESQSLRDFKGVNTQSHRTVIGDDQFAWLENVIPIGFGNLRVVPHRSDTLWTWPSQVYAVYGFNLNDTEYAIGLALDGSIYAANLGTEDTPGTYAITTVAAAGTLSGSNSDAAQFQNTQILFIDAKGYFSWDGSAFQNWDGTIQSLTIPNIGINFTGTPTIGFSGGGGSGAAATCDIHVGNAILVAAGTNYAVGDVLTISGGTSTIPATIVVASVNTTTGAITGINLTGGGDYTVPPANPAAVTGGYGTGATFTLNFGIGPITLTNVGSGYTSTPTVSVSGGGGSGAQVVAALSAVPPSGTCLSTVNGRVWAAKSRTILFSGPDTYNDFTDVAAGGAKIMTDESLHSTVKALIAANSYLYVFGSTSINTFSDVTVTSGITTFSNTNVSANIGTSSKWAIQPYYRGVWLKNNSGIYGLYGTTTNKASSDIDGTTQLLDNSFISSAAVGTVYEILMLGFLVHYKDPSRSVDSRPIILMFFDKKWWVASPSTDLLFMWSSMQSDTQTFFGTNGLDCYTLFSDTTQAKSHTIKTKLWDMGEATIEKASYKVGVDVIGALEDNSINGTLDTELEDSGVEFTLQNNNILTFTDSSGNPMTFLDSGGDPLSFFGSGFSFSAVDIQTAGRYLGVTLTATGASTIYSGVHLQFSQSLEWPQ